MNAIRNVFAAFANLAASLNALAGVIDQATGRLKQQLAFEPAEVPIVLEHQASPAQIAGADGEQPGQASGNGRNRKAPAAR